MRALTLTQPWCGLVASGIKLVENRPRSIIRREDFGKPFALHASREIDGDVFERIWEIAPEMRGSPSPEWFKLAQRTSAVIAVATVERAVVLNGADALDYHGRGGEPIVDLGNQRRWFFGPIGYVLRDVRVLAKPVPCRGWQGFWTLTPNVEARVLEQIASAAP